MENLRSEYERSQLRTGWDLERDHPDIVPRTKLEEVWAWEDYALKHFMKWIASAYEPQQITDGAA